MIGKQTRFALQHNGYVDFVILKKHKKIQAFFKSKKLAIVVAFWYYTDSSLIIKYSI